MANVFARSFKTEVLISSLLLQGEQVFSQLKYRYIVFYGEQLSNSDTFYVQQ